MKTYIMTFARGDGLDFLVIEAGDDGAAREHALALCESESWELQRLYRAHPVKLQESGDG